MKTKSLQQILDEMNEAITTFDIETKKIFEDWKKQNEQIFDNYKKNIYDIEQRHKDFMLKIGGKQK